MEISWRFVVKAIVFGVLLAISIKVPLWTAIEEFTDPGTKTRRSTLLVSSYKSPAFTLCFAPPFNASSNLYYDYFLGSTSDFSWHAETPLWNLFYQSSYRIQKDFELKFSYYGTSFTVNDKVLEEGKLIGIITDGDLRRALLKVDDISTIKTVDIMTQNPQTIFPEQSLGEALKEMEKRKPSPISILPVECNQKKTLLGLIRLHDILA